MLSFPRLDWPWASHLPWVQLTYILNTSGHDSPLCEALWWCPASDTKKKPEALECFLALFYLISLIFLESTTALVISQILQAFAAMLGYSAKCTGRIKQRKRILGWRRCILICIELGHLISLLFTQHQPVLFGVFSMNAVEESSNFQ